MSKKTVLWLCIGLALVALGLLAGFASGWHNAPGSGELTTLASFDVSEITAVRIEATSAEVRIYGTDGGDLELDGAGPEGRRFTAELSGGVLTVRQGEEKRFLFRRSDGYAVLWIPQKNPISLTAETDSGELTVSSVRADRAEWVLTTASGEAGVFDSTLGALTVNTASGEVFLDEVTAAGTVRVRSNSGDLYFRNLEASSLDAASSSGDVRLYRSGVDAAALETTSGSVDADDVTVAALEVVTTSGSVELDDTEFESLSVQSGSGSVGLELPGSTEDYTFDLASSSGSVDAPRGGDGSRQVRVRTGSGSIEVECN